MEVLTISYSTSINGGNKVKEAPPLKYSESTKVRHRNSINQTFLELPLAAKRVLFLCLAQIDSKKIIPEGTTYRIYAKDYAEVCGVSARNTAYQQLRDASEKLQRQLIKIPKDQLLAPIPRKGERPWKKPTGKGFRMLNVTEFCDYEEGAGYVDISFTRLMEPYICWIKGDYTTQVLLSVARLSDPNSSKLYQLVREQISSGKKRSFTISVDELKERMELYTTSDGGSEKVYSYPQFKDLNKFVLKPSCKVISDITELNITVDIAERRGRKAESLRFSYEIDNQMSLDLD